MQIKNEKKTSAFSKCTNIKYFLKNGELKVKFYIRAGKLLRSLLYDCDFFIVRL